MDAHSLEIIEFAKIRDQLARHASSSLGRERIESLAPYLDPALAEEEIALTTEMVDAAASRLNPPLGGLKDVRQPVQRAGLGVLLEIEQVLAIHDILDLTGRVREYWNRLPSEFERLNRLLADVEDLRPLALVIDRVMDGRGNVYDEASPELASVRKQIAEIDRRIQSELRRILRDPEIKKALRFASPTISEGHHVLAVAVNYRHLVVGIVHRASSTGETIYVEPAKVAQLHSELSILRSAETREIRRILRGITSHIGNKSAVILKALDILGEVDLLYAKALYAREFKMSPPKIDREGKLVLRAARHPLLEQLFRDQTSEKEPDAGPNVVPIDVRLGDAFDMLVITGPNTGGKTAALKTVGLLSLMALSGLHIPAEPGSVVPWLTNVLVDIGDEQSLEQSLSTFSGHITRIREILKLCNPTTLVLLDELGGGTEPGEGAALGRAILDELMSSGCRSMITTHLGELKTFAWSRERAENGAVEFDAATLRPTYRLVLGQVGESCALKIARRLKMPSQLLKRAHRYLKRRSGRGGPAMADLERLRVDAQRAREEADEARRDAEKAAEELRIKAELLEQESSVKEQIEAARQTLQAGDLVRVVHLGRTGTVVRVDRKKRLAEVNVGKIAWKVKLDELVPETKQ